MGEIRGLVGIMCAREVRVFEGVEAERGSRFEQVDAAGFDVIRKQTQIAVVIKVGKAGE